MTRAKNSERTVAGSAPGSASRGSRRGGGGASRRNAPSAHDQLAEVASSVAQAAMDNEVREDGPRSREDERELLERDLKEIMLGKSEASDTSGMPTIDEQKMANASPMGSSLAALGFQLRNLPTPTRSPTGSPMGRDVAGDLLPPNFGMADGGCSPTSPAMPPPPASWPRISGPEPWALPAQPGLRSGAGCGGGSPCAGSGACGGNAFVGSGAGGSGGGGSAGGYREWLQARGQQAMQRTGMRGHGSAAGPPPAGPPPAVGSAGPMPPPMMQPNGGQQSPMVFSGCGQQVPFMSDPSRQAPALPNLNGGQQGSQMGGPYSPMYGQQSQMMYGGQQSPIMGQQSPMMFGGVGGPQSPMAMPDFAQQAMMMHQEAMMMPVGGQDVPMVMNNGILERQQCQQGADLMATLMPCAYACGNIDSTTVAEQLMAAAAAVGPYED